MTKKTHNMLFAYLMMAPFLFFFFMFVTLPGLLSIGLSVTYYNMLETPRWVGAENFVTLLLADDVFLISLRNTLVFAMITGPIGYILSFLFAWLINELNRYLRAIMTVVYYGPTLAGNLFFMWLYIFSGDAYGLANSTLMRFGIIRDPIIWLLDVRYNSIITMIVMIWMSMGVGFLAFLAGMQTLNKSLSEAGALDGIRNRWQELFYITIPQLGPMLMFGAVMAIAGSFAVGHIPATLTGFPSTDYSTHTLTLHMQDVGFTRFEMGYAGAIAVFLYAMLIFVRKIINKLLGRYM